LAGRVRIETFDPVTEPAKIRAAYRLMTACLPVDDPDGPPMSEAFFSAMLEHGWGEPQEMALAWGDGDEACGGYVLELSQRENRHMGFVNFTVTPAHRRHGIGTELLRHAAQTACGQLRTLLFTYIKVGSAAEAFADGMGGRPGLVSVRRVLDIDAIPAGHLAALLARAGRAAAGYSLLSWEGPAPPERIDEVAALRNALADAPHQPGKEVRVVDAEWIRQGERRSAKQGLRRYSVAARYNRSGELAGLTQVCVDPHTPDWASQLVTAVSRAHRGHRLGLLVKVVMLDLLARAEPGLRRMSTGNAQDNVHMVAINEEIGFRVLDQWRFWEIDVATVLA
jgi:RimJ/RimL family protein N-acetyltransferase